MSVYDDKTFTNAADLDIDDMMPLRTPAASPR
jgi:hypothetical protein